MTFDTGEKPNHERPVVLTPLAAPEQGGLRVQHIMYAVGVCAFLAWLAVVNGVWLLLGGLTGVFALAVGFAVVRARRATSQQESLLWALAIAAERSLPLGPAALAFADQFGRSFRWRVQLLASLLDNGTPLPEALDQVPGLLSREAEVLVKVGWTTGTLPRALRDAAGVRAMRRAAWGSAAARFTYLLWVLMSMQVIVGFVMYFILPKFEAIFKDFGVSLPPVTIGVILASHVVVEYGFLTIPLLLLEILLALLLPLGLFNVFRWDVPVLDALFRRRHTALILRALALTVEGNTPVVKAVSALADDYPSGWVRRRLRRVAEDLNHGRGWVESLLDRSLIRRADAAVLESSQRVGNVAWALREMADSNERRLGYRLQFLLQWLFPLLVIGLGTLVMLIAVAFFMPLVQLIEVLAG